MGVRSLVGIENMECLVSRLDFANAFHDHNIFHSQGSWHAFDSNVVWELVHGNQWYGDIIGSKNIELWLECIGHRYNELESLPVWEEKCVVRLWLI